MKVSRVWICLPEGNTNGEDSEGCCFWKKERSNSGPDFYLHQKVTRTHKMSSICRRCHPCAIRFTEVPFWSSILIWNISGQRTRLFWAPMIAKPHQPCAAPVSAQSDLWRQIYSTSILYLKNWYVYLLYIGTIRIMSADSNYLLLFERFLLILHNNNNWIIWIISTYLRQLINCVW